MNRKLQTNFMQSTTINHQINLHTRTRKVLQTTQRLTEGELVRIRLDESEEDDRKENAHEDCSDCEFLWAVAMAEEALLCFHTALSLSKWCNSLKARAFSMWLQIHTCSFCKGQKPNSSQLQS